MLYPSDPLRAYCPGSAIALGEDNVAAEADKLHNKLPLVRLGLDDAVVARRPVA